MIPFQERIKIIYYDTDRWIIASFLWGIRKQNTAPDLKVSLPFCFSTRQKTSLEEKTAFNEIMEDS